MRARSGRLLPLFGFALTAALPLSATAADTSFFERIASFPVYKTLPEGADLQQETSAEIISASGDGRTLVFTDSPGRALGFVDITNPAGPASKGRVALQGEPTSVAVAGDFALVAVNTSESYADPSGSLLVVDMISHDITARCDVAGQPDSVAVSPDGRFVAIAIENERDEELNDGVIPQSPEGSLAVFDLDGKGAPTNCGAVRSVDLRGLSEIAPNDPEPEFVSINDAGQAVVTIQENNHLAIVDLESGKVTHHFSAGVSSAANIPTRKARMSDASGSIENVRREPDAVAWLDDERFVTANEGDYQGGSRGFTIWNTSGEVLFDSGNALEHLGMRTGQYPAKRAHKKGVEPEGVTVGTFGGDKLIFISAERANFTAVYRDTGGTPDFVQFLPTHVAPEGLLALPDRDLFVVANEADSAEDGVRAHVGIYRYGASAPQYPTIVSADDPQTHAPIGWGALSGLAADPDDAAIVYAVNDSFYDAARIYRVDVSAMPATIVSQVTLHDGAAEKYDLEGIATRSGGGFWAVSEGNAKKGLANLLLSVSADGTVEKEIALPAAIADNAVRFGFEGVATYRVDGEERVVVAFQRPWKDDGEGLVKIGVYDPDAETWGFVHYRLDEPASPAGGWVGLSEIVNLGGTDFAVVERDNKGGEMARIKQVTRISLDGVTPVPAGQSLPEVGKTRVLDLLPVLAERGGWILDKVEGLTLTADGRVLMVTDNDGVDDAPGETIFVELGHADILKK